MMTITAVPLTAEAFAPFGDVVTHRGEPPLMPCADTFEHTAAATRVTMAVLRVEAPVRGPVEITRLERHPHSAQTFIPLKGGRSLIVVCGTAADGRPLLASARAFVAGSTQGVTYRRDVWHRSVTALEAPSEYVVLMVQTEDGSDNLFDDLDHPLLVEVD
ncbi:MAG TPA: ureidoglycolate lyase [Aliidongia sp.]|uniref:ureidoglycolate lyase n=1 Tax=Aliidongia sp. TaxID=1914230 RepID=UPI002DDD4311|nr:ureidoglycolate lyase [Aliidongia sp.]HEV2677078.1 ureidoglycolate lyase [Aliidongia sp.]